MYSTQGVLQTGILYSHKVIGFSVWQTKDYTAIGLSSEVALWIQSSSIRRAVVETEIRSRGVRVCSGKEKGGAGVTDTMVATAAAHDIE